MRCRWWRGKPPAKSGEMINFSIKECNYSNNFYEGKKAEVAVKMSRPSHQVLMGPTDYGIIYEA